MTEGISKERLKEILNSEANRRNKELQFYLGWLITTECKELDPWLPIDENTPLDRPIWLWNGVKHLAVRWNERNNDWWIAISFGNSKEPLTHYKELPSDPK